MPPETSISDDTEAFLDNFKGLNFEQQKGVLAACQNAMNETIRERLAALDAERAELLALTGRPEASAPNHAADANGRSGKPAPIKYFDAKSGGYSSGRGSWQKAEWVKAHIESGGTIDQLLVGPDNPLPAHLE